MPASGRSVPNLNVDKCGVGGLGTRQSPKASGDLGFSAGGTLSDYRPEKHRD
ncbi:hypothetical protein NDU88_004014, partial [Pleurodeles waltl]